MTSAGHGLPVELVQKIVVCAAENDRHCAYAMAFVSRAVCQWTAKARLHTIALTTIRQYCAFARVMLGLEDEDMDILLQIVIKDYPSLESIISERRDWKKLGLENAIDACMYGIGHRQDLRQFISFPTENKPHTYIRHLLIDITDSDDTSKGGLDAWATTYAKALHTADTTDTTEMQKDFRISVRTTLYKIMSLDPFQFLWSLDFNLKHLCLGPKTLHLLTGKSGSINYRSEELTLMLHGDEDEVDHDCWRKLIDACNFLEKLHIIAEDNNSSLSGVEPPWQNMYKIKHTGLKQLRYDTRKFSFKPAEIFASRLRPMLQEPAVSLDDSNSSATTPVSSYQHSGPRHAAPLRGSGKSSASHNISSLTPLQNLEKGPMPAYLAEEMRRCSLDLLHFAWDPMNPREKTSEDIPWHQRARFSSGNSAEDITGNDKMSTQARGAPSSSDTGGWPREVKGAWTERSDRDLAPNFAVELRDAINALYGWDAPGIEAAAKFCARKAMVSKKSRHLLENFAFSPDFAGELVEKIKNGLKENDKVLLRNAKNFLNSELKLDHGITSSDLDIISKLQFGTRAPRSLIHLGGKVPYEMEDRMALFEDRARGGKGAWP